LILNMPSPITTKQFLSMLGHIGYYRNFNRNYASITSPLENLLNKSKAFSWTLECDQSFDTLKEKSSIYIRVYLNWKVEFHIPIDASSIALGESLVQPGEGNPDHPIYFSSRNISQDERNYTTTEREGLEMVYDLQNFRHYFPRSHFKFFIDHSALKYLVNRHVLEGRICR